MTDEHAVHDTTLGNQPGDRAEPLSSQYGFVRARQLEGTYPGDAETGNWLVTTMRVSCGWGAVPESDYPRTITWPPDARPELDAKAKVERVHHYQRVRSAAECCILLGHLLPVAAALDITDQWFETENGVIRVPGPGERIVGSHGVMLIGFDRLYDGFVFQNSWGKEWGNRGFGLLPFEYFDKHLVSAWTMHGARPTPDSVSFEGVGTLSWGKLDCLGNSLHGGDVIHGREVYDRDGDERMAWTFVVHREGFLDVEEIFVRPQYRGQGHGSQLVHVLVELAAMFRRPLRLWIPFADWTPSNIPAVERIVEKLGLSLFHADVRWAAAMALDPNRLATHPTDGVSLS